MRNFGVNLLRNSVLRDDGEGVIISSGFVLDNRVVISLLRWSEESGQVVKVLGPQIWAVAPQVKSNSHIRDIAWAPDHIKFSASATSNSRALAVVTEAALLIFEIVFTKGKTVIEAAHLVSTIDVNALLKSNKNETPGNICSSCSHLQWHPSALPTVFLFRPKGAPVRVTMRKGKAGK